MVQAPIFAYKFSRLISIHFLTELVGRIWLKNQSIFSLAIIFSLIPITFSLSCALIMLGLQGKNVETSLQSNKDTRDHLNTSHNLTRKMSQLHYLAYFLKHCLPRESDSKTRAVVEQSDKCQFKPIKFGTHL